jgi:hypothetical protein
MSATLAALEGTQGSSVSTSVSVALMAWSVPTARLIVTGAPVMLCNRVAFDGLGYGGDSEAALDRPVLEG